MGEKEKTIQYKLSGNEVKNSANTKGEIIKSPSYIEEISDKYLNNKNIINVSSFLLGSITIFVIISGIKKLIERRFSKFAEKTSNYADDLILLIVKNTLKLTIVLVSIKFTVQFVKTNSTLLSFINSSLSLILLIQAAVWASGSLKVILKGLINQSSADGKSEEAQSAYYLIEFGIKFLIWSLVTLAIISFIGFDVSGLITGLGIGGVAVALAVQTVLKDLFSSLSIVLDKPFVIGDFIILDSNIMGTVERIGIKSTRLRSISGEQLIIANSDLINSRIKNYKRMYQRRVVERIGVTYETDSQKIKEIPHQIQDIIIRENRVKFERAHFLEFGDYALNFEVVYHVLTSDYKVYMDIKQKINLAIFDKFSEEGIEFAYPTQTIIVNPDNTLNKCEK